MAEYKIERHSNVCVTDLPSLTAAMSWALDMYDQEYASAGGVVINLYSVQTEDEPPSWTVSMAGRTDGEVTTTKGWTKI